MANKIKVIIKRPDEEYGHMTWISNTLENLQRNVGGFIETVTLGVVPRIVIICNEEGRLQGLPYNCTICGHAFVGDIIIAGIDGDEFADVPMTMQEYKRNFFSVKEEDTQ